jgi:hypothetical protein
VIASAAVFLVTRVPNGLPDTVAAQAA